MLEGVTSFPPLSLSATSDTSVRQTNVPPSARSLLTVLFSRLDRVILVSSRQYKSVPPASATESVQHYSGVLHEVSNALTVVLGWLEMANQAGSDEERQKALKVATEHARRGQTMARRSIGADVSSGYQVRTASALANFAAVSVEPQAFARGVQVCASPEQGTDVPVEGDGSILQILTNLLLNAIEFSPPESTVTVFVRRTEGGLLYCVADEGPGVAAAIAQELFCSSVSTRAGGAGIGLPFSRALAQKNGGDLRLLPAGEGGSSGACFELYWPESDLPLSASTAPPAPPPAELEGSRILVIEDDESIVSMVQLSLESRGAEVLPLINPSQIEDTLQGCPVFDLALVDLSPIVGRVAEVLARLKFLSPQAPIVLMSGEPTGIPEEAGERFATWLRKPFDITELLRIVAKELGD